MNLKKFKELAKNKSKRNIAISLFLFILLIGGILLYRSYAVYQEDKTFNVLQGVIPDFSKPLNLGEYIIEKSQTDNTIEKIEHEATEQTPALTDYRYVGASPNNYVYFGCSDNCTEDNLYRIIGVIPTQSSENGEYEERVKLIKSNYYTEDNWNNNDSNKWEESTLQSQVLNGVYWSNLGEYQNFIEPAKWYLGGVVTPDSGFSTSSIDQIYKEERGKLQGYSKGNTSFIGNIGLMYPSDYGYSAGSEYRNQSVYSHPSFYKESSWVIGQKLSEWTINQAVNPYSAQVWEISHTSGNMRVNWPNSASQIVRPTFYLKQNVLKIGGDGTLSNPYRIAI